MDPQHLAYDELGIALSMALVNPPKQAAKSAPRTPPTPPPEPKKQAKQAQEKPKGPKGKPAAKTTPQPTQKKKWAPTQAVVIDNDDGPLPDLVGNKNFSGSPTGEKYYLTTAISYTNGMPHMGHAYESLTTDIFARWHRVYGRRTFYLTGTDEHGQKIANTAEAQGLKPIDICDKYAGEFQRLNRRMRVSNDHFIRTTMPEHHKLAQELWVRCANNGDIYLDNYKGWYLEREEMFVTPKDAEEWGFKDPVSGVPLKEMEESSYFFRLTKYREALITLIRDDKVFCLPEERRAQLLGMLGEDMTDLSISRTSFQWGIPVPEGFDQNHVMYVWFDALSNYVTGVNGTDQSDANPNKGMWPADVHIIGKDIIRFHCIYWPAMLMSAGVPLPKTVFAHGFVSDAEGRKMSKSLGNVVDPHDMLNKYPSDTFRFYISTEAPYGGDLRFSEESLVRTHNGPLADTLGNLVHRCTNLCKKYTDAQVPELSTLADAVSAIGTPFDPRALATETDEAFKRFDLQGAKDIAMEACRNTNNWLAKLEPWKMKDDRVAERTATIGITLEAVYFLAHLFSPFLPHACTEVFRRLGTPARAVAGLDVSFHNLSPGVAVTVGDPLFPKLPEPEAAAEGGAAAAEPAKPAPKAQGKGTAKGAKGPKGAAKAPPQGEEETTCVFNQLDIRVGEIVEVWNHPEADRLYCEKIVCGEDEPREVASGLREHVPIEKMKGQKVFVVCNLKPAKMVGFTSHGMVLCAKGADGTVEFVEPPSGANVGDRLLPETFSGGTAPFPASQVKKKKVWETVAQSLQADGAGLATWDGIKLVVGSAYCKAPTVRNGPIS